MSAEATLGSLVLQWHKTVPYATALQRGDRYPQNAPIPDSLTEVIHDVGASKFFLCPKSKCASAPLATNHSTDLFKLYLRQRRFVWRLVRITTDGGFYGIIHVAWKAGSRGCPGEGEAEFRHVCSRQFFLDPPRERRH
jgi:hypothetical protein